MSFWAVFWAGDQPSDQFSPKTVWITFNVSVARKSLSTSCILFPGFNKMLFLVKKKMQVLLGGVRLVNPRPG